MPKPPVFTGSAAWGHSSSKAADTGRTFVRDEPEQKSGLTPNKSSSCISGFGVRRTSSSARRICSEDRPEKQIHDELLFGLNPNKNPGSPRTKVRRVSRVLEFAEQVRQLDELVQKIGRSPIFLRIRWEGCGCINRSRR